MHELLYAAAPAAAGAWYGTRAWMARRRAPLGEMAEDFSLLGTDGRRHSLSSLEAPVVVLLFMSNRCPGVKAYDGRLRRLTERFGSEVALVGINPIDEGHYPSESLAGMKRAVKERGLDLLYLKDRDQHVAAAFGAVCTPEVVVLDADRRLRYRGRIDDSLVERNVRKHYLVDAIAALRKGKRPRVAETVPLGCSIDAAATNPIVQGAQGAKARPDRNPVRNPA
jgi:peroxiredoxin